MVGQVIDSSPRAALTTNALGMAIDNREPSPGTVIPSDHGVWFGPQAKPRPGPEAGPGLAGDQSKIGGIICSAASGIR